MRFKCIRRSVNASLDFSFNSLILSKLKGGFGNCYLHERRYVCNVCMLCFVQANFTLKILALKNWASVSD